MLVWVASYPRSGNTLTMMVLRDVFGIGRIGTVMVDDLDLGRVSRALPPTTASLWRPPPEFEGRDKSELLDLIRGRPETFFLKTHRVSEAADPAPAIYIVRDGRDALVSQAHFVADRKDFGQQPFEERLAELVENGISNRGTWSVNVATWSSRDAPTAVIRYEELIADPPGTVAAAFRELGLPSPRTVGAMPTFAEARELMPKIFRRGQVGGWRDEMPPKLEQRFWSKHGAEMAALGYSRFSS